MDVVVPVIDELGQCLINMRVVVVFGSFLQGGLVGIGLYCIQISLCVGVHLAGEVHLLKKGLDRAGIALPERFGLVRLNPI